MCDYDEVRKQCTECATKLREPSYMLAFATFVIMLIRFGFVPDSQKPQ